MFSRLELLIGQENIEKIHQKKVILFGVGGVGGYCLEALVRSGVGFITLVDNDTVSVSNLNRQIIATQKTIGESKTEVAKRRALSINPDCQIETYNLFYLPESANQIDLSQFDYVIDAIDTVTAKLELVQRCEELNVPIISCMGTGNKLHPELLEVDDIYNTSVCPLAKVMRRELKKRGIKKLKVVYSKEQPIKVTHKENEKVVPGSTAFVPSSAGLLIASEVMRDLIKD